jgi:hypothetical protein
MHRLTLLFLFLSLISTLQLVDANPTSSKVTKPAPNPKPVPKPKPVALKGKPVAKKKPTALKGKPVVKEKPAALKGEPVAKKGAQPASKLPAHPTVPKQTNLKPVPKPPKKLPRVCFKICHLHDSLGLIGEI